MANKKSVGGRRGPFKNPGVLVGFCVCVLVALSFVLPVAAGRADPARLRYIQFIGHSADLTDAEYSPDGKEVVTASSDKTARIGTPLTASCSKP